MMKLWLLMRSDLPSMNAGKLAAQATHVAHSLTKRVRAADSTFTLGNRYEEWEGGRAFGTVICLSATKEQIRGALDALLPVLEVTAWAEAVHDPTYPSYIPGEAAAIIAQCVGNEPLIYRGEPIQFIPESDLMLRNEMVGAYVFGDDGNEEIKSALGDLKLWK